MWWPVSDDENEWISVGNYDVGNRLGNTHSHLGFKAPWGNSHIYQAERTKIAVVPTGYLLNLTLQGFHFNLSFFNKILSMHLIFCQ